MSRVPTPSDFAVLGLRPGASDDEIREAYRRLAKVHHPDRNPGDPQALVTFRRLSESYAALRARPRPASAEPRTPLSAAVRRRASPRAPTATAAAHLADLPLGGSVWVAADAVLVGPDRATALRPGASGSAFPTAAKVIRVERRGDGHHVFMPPQPSARWPISAAAESEGLTVVKLWVGDRQDDEPGHGSAPRMPRRLMTATVAEMDVDAQGWVAAEALGVDDDGHWSLDPAEPVSRAPHRATPVRVRRDGDGYRVQSDVAAAAWVPRPRSDDHRLPVASATLASQLPEPPPLSGD